MRKALAQVANTTLAPDTDDDGQNRHATAKAFLRSFFVALARRFLGKPHEQAMNVFVSLGSNLHPYHNMVQMLGALCKLSPRVAVSPIAVTEPVGFSSSNLFLNAVARVSSNLSLEQLKERLVSVEQSLGRDRQHPESSRRDRSADIDILFSLSPSQQCVPADIIPSESYVRPMLIALIHDLGMECVEPYPDLPAVVKILPGQSALGIRSSWLSHEQTEENGSFRVHPITCDE